MKERLTRAQKRERTHGELVSSAERLFVERGFHASTVDEIALEAGYTKGAVYSNFASKEDLFFAVYERRAGRAIAEIEEILEEKGPAAGLEALASDAARRRGGRLARGLLRVLGARGASPRAARSFREDPWSCVGAHGRCDRAFRGGAWYLRSGRGEEPQRWR